MDQQEWTNISEIIDTALDLEAEKRATYIAKKCQGNREVKRKVTELLESIEEADSENYLEGAEAYPDELAADFSLANSTSKPALIGTTIDRYKVIELIEHGGMGSVYIAKRADDAYERKVAFKIMRRGMDTPSNIARFKRERNILANLDHPNIARLLDGGVTQDGLPYLVMEYIKGIPLLEYCNTHQLSIEKRLELFTSVCKAVKHAHRNATIHRDLKPSNILVTADGTVKVLDFGIAKLMMDSTADSTFQTRTGARMMTLGYAAPEQYQNNAVTTATDIYTLGILMYQLLTGSSPFDIESKNLANLEKHVLGGGPAKPADKFAKLPESQKTKIASQRGTIPSFMTQKIRGDLGAIIMKALRREPKARYRSVEQMLEDLSRYEHAQPLIAQSDTLKYRVGKFLKRNRKAVVGACLILAAIIGFGSYHIDQITEERNIAEAEAQKAETVKNFLVDIFRSSNPQSTSYEGKNVTARELMLNGQNRITGKLKDQPDVYIEVLTAIGDALTGIDAFAEAEESYRKALSQTPQIADSLESKVRIYVKLGQLESKRRTGDQAILKPVHKAHQLLISMSNPPSALKASVFSLLGRVNVFVENYELANSYYEKADSIYSSAGMGNSFDYMQMLSGYGKSLIYVSDFRKAKQVLLQSNKLHRKAFSNPTMTIAENYKFLGWVNRDLGNFKQSNHYFLKSIELNSRLTGEESMPAALSMYHLSINYFLSADYKKAEQLAQEVLHTYQKLLEPTNDYINGAKKYVAIAKYNQNKLSEAKQLLQEIITSRTKHMGEDNFNLAGPFSHLAVVYQKQENYKKAISLLKKSIWLYKRKLGEYNRRVARAKIKLASAYREMGKYKPAREYFQQVQSIHQKVVPGNNHQQAEFYFHFAKLKQDMDEPQEARKYFQQAYSIYLDIFGESSNRTKQAKSYLEQVTQA